MIYILSGCGLSLHTEYTPGFTVWMMKQLFDRESERLNSALEKYLPEGVNSIQNEIYENRNGLKANLDIHYPSAISKGDMLPTIVWVHGGAWISGKKEDISNYGKILAGHNFTVVVIDYTLAPQRQYPYQVGQLNRALEYLVRNAERLYIDPNRLFLAGDSAGANISAQYANLLYNPSYANDMGIEPLIKPEQLNGLLLYCGPYDIDMIDFNNRYSRFLEVVCKAYSGKKDFMSVPEFKLISVLNYLTPEYPPIFISGGNGDPLTPHSIEMSKRLSDLGVPVSSLFFPEEYEPKLLHEYQFNLDTDAGNLALKRSVEFIRAYSQRL